MYCCVNEWYKMDDEAIEKYELEVRDSCNKHEFDKDDKEFIQK